MSIKSHLKAASLGSILSSVFVAASFHCLAAIVSHAQAAEPFADSDERSFSFFVKTPDATVEEIRYWYEVEEGGNKLKSNLGDLTKRYSRNFVLGVPRGDQPDFSLMKEFIHREGATKTIMGRIPTEKLPFIERSTYRFFTQRLIAGPPLVSEVGPIYKRAIFLRRAEKASPETVTSELSGFAGSVAGEVKDMSRRVMLYTMVGDSRNYPMANYPGNNPQPRRFDAILMIWPKEGRVIPSTFTLGPPSNYQVLYTVNFESYDSPAN